MTTKPETCEILLPLALPWDWSADYVRQTVLELAHRNHRIHLYFAYKPTFWIKRMFARQRALPSLSNLPPNVYLHNPIYFLPFQRFPQIKKFNDVLSLWLLRLHLNRTSKKKILWIFDPDFSSYLNFFKGWRSIYDCVDYHSERDPFKNVQTRKQNDLLIQESELCVVNSHILKKIHSALRKDIFIVPQGFSINSFSEAESGNKNTPKKTKPIVGFVGAIDQRLDWELLLELVKNHPEWTFVIWGPLQIDHLPKEEIERIRSAYQEIIRSENVKTGHSIRRESLKKIIATFDVGLIPYDTFQTITKYSYPMKVIEYLFCGIPIISSPIEELKRLKDFVIIAKTLPEWEISIKKILARPWKTAQKNSALQFAKDNSWSKKIDAISKLSANYFQITL